jgi:hypothetical protein
MRLRFDRTDRRMTWRASRVPLPLVAAFLVVGAVEWQGRDTPDGKTESQREVERQIDADGEIKVGPPIHVSVASPALEHTEYAADAAPDDPRKVMVCTMLYSPQRNRFGSGVYSSSDGGRVWQLTVHDTAPGDVLDPACAYGARGRAFFAAVVAGTMPADSLLGYSAWPRVRAVHMPLYRSGDGASTWAAPEPFGFLDNPHVTVDHTGGPYDGRIYIYGRNIEPDFKGLWLIYSADSGRTLQQSALGAVADPAIRRVSPAGQGAVLPNGTFLRAYMLAGTGPRRSIGVGATNDGGRHVLAPRVVATIPECVWGDYEDDAFRTMPGAALPTMAADQSHGPFRGRAYVVWGQRFRNHCAVMLAYSDNAGLSWSKPVKVSDERPRPQGRAGDGPDTFLATIAVNANGTVGVSWYDRREDPANRNHRLRFSASLDGGETWLPSVPVSDRSFVYATVPQYPPRATGHGGGRWGRASGSDMFETTVRPAETLYDGWNSGMGDYASMAASVDGRFHVFWIDNRTGVAQLYTSAVTVTGRAVRNGSGDLALLENVTPLLELQYTSSAYDATAHTVTLDYTLLNTSTDTIVGPLKLRLVALDSDLGTPTLLLPGNRVGRAGTVIDLTDALKDGVLQPSQRTASRRVRVRLDPIADVMGRRRDIVRFDAKAYATRRDGHP